MIAAPLLILSALAAAPVDTVRREPVQFASGDVTIAATLVRPAASGRVPAVVIVHGSGGSGRDNPWTTAWVDALAQRGIAVLYPDKRGSGSSTGSWRTASIQDLARDAEAAIAHVRSHPGIDTSRIVALGFSQGGYVASLLAAGSAPVTAVAVISGGTASLREQMIDELVLEAVGRGTPLGGRDLELVRDVYARAFRFGAAREGWVEYIAALEAGRSAGGAVAHALRTMPADSTHWALRWVGAMGDFDPMPAWSRARRPVLLIYGGKDANVNVQASVARIAALPDSQRARFTSINVGGNAHTLFRDDAVAFLAEWVRSGGAH